MSVKCILAEQSGRGGSGGAAFVAKKIEITKYPLKTTYTSGESFDPSGMELTVSYGLENVGAILTTATVPASACVITPTTLTDSTDYVNISYTENGITVSARISVTINAALAGISITPPTKQSYSWGDNFNTSGLTVEAQYTSGPNQTVTDYTLKIGNTTISNGTTFNTSAFNIGTNTVIVSYTEEGESASTTFDITISKKSLIVPTQTGTLTYTGSNQSPTLSNYDGTLMEISGNSQANAGTYTATVSLKDAVHYQWSDNTATNKSISWTINNATITNEPAQSGTLTYNGNSQSPTWSNYNSTQLTLGGTTSSINAGSFTATFTPKTNYQWSDGNTTAKNKTWTIGKAAGSLTLDKTSITIKDTTPQTVTITKVGDGAISYSPTTITGLTLSLSGNTLTITGDGGTAVSSTTITINVAADTNYTAPANKTVAVSASYWEWGDETAIGDASWWANLKTWAINTSASERQNCVGKKKKVSLSTSVLGANVSSMICIGADQDGEKTLTFQTEGTLPNDARFGDNALWDGSNVQTECNNFSNYCNASASIKSITKLTCSVTGSKNNPADVSTTAKCWLPSEQEMGLNTYAPSRLECTSGTTNTGYSYYTSNDSRIKYKMNSEGSITSVQSYYWMRSRIFNFEDIMCSIDSVGRSGSTKYYYSIGLAPAFVIG